MPSQQRTLKFSYLTASLVLGVGRIDFLGIEHSLSPDAEVFKVVKNFLGDCDLYVVEGLNNLRANIAKDLQDRSLKYFGELSESEAIKEAGESGLVAQLGYQRGISVLCPEPGLVDLATYAISCGFKAEHFITWQILVNLPPLIKLKAENHGEAKLDLKEDTRRRLRKFESELGTVQPFTSLVWEPELILAVVKELGYNLTWSSSDWETVYRITEALADDGNEKGTPLTQMSKVLCNFRDNWICNQIIRYLERHSVISVVYGSGHITKLIGLISDYTDAYL